MSKLLINEPPLQVIPSLAQKIGLNEAIVLQQIHYWLENPKIGKRVDDKKWIFNSVRQWKEENFPFWSEATIKRTLTSLLKLGLIHTRSDLNAKGFDKTKWYTINYETLNNLEKQSVTKPLGQNDPTIRSDCTNGTGQDDQTNTRDYQETTTEREPAPDPLTDIVNQQGKVSEVTAPNPEDQWFEYSDKFLKLFQKKMGRYPNEDEKTAISELAGRPEADIERWELSLKECNLNYTGHQCPVTRMVEVYNAGGTWAQWVLWKDKQDEEKNGKQPRPDEELEKILDPVTGEWTGGYYT